MSTENTPKADAQPRAGSPWRSLLLVSCLVGAALLGGFLLGRRFPGPVRQGGASPRAQEQITSPDTDEEDAFDRTAADELLTTIGAEIRKLSARREALSREAREGRIAYNLLRQRGYTDDAPECKGLIDRQKTLRADLTKVESALEEARGLYERVVQATQWPHADSGSRQIDRRLRTEVREYLWRRSRPTGTEAPIPDERWGGGPDRYMNTEDW